MKRILSILLVLVMCIGVFAACNNLDPVETESGTTPEVVETGSGDTSDSGTETTEATENPDNTEGAIKTETAYKLFITQGSLSKTLYLTSEATTKYIKTTEKAADAPDFYAEKSGNGYKFYYKSGESKTYIKAWLEAKDDGKTSKCLGFGADGSVFNYDETLKVLSVEIDGGVYCLGTYNQYDTAAISDSKYFTADAVGKTQFPVEFILSSEVGTGNNGAGNNGSTTTPSDLSSIADLIALGNSKEHNTYTTEEYLVKGVIVEFGDTDSAKVYGNFYIEDEAGNRIYVFGLNSADGETRFDKLNPQPKLGDTVTIQGIVGKYNSNPQMKSTKLIELVAFDPTACTHRYTADCDTKCNFCNAERTVSINHSFENACDAECDNCGTTRTPDEHKYDNACDNECNVCKFIRNVGAHVDTADSNQICDICGKTIVAATGASLAVFEFGENVDTSEHKDNSSALKADKATFTVGNYTLALTDLDRVYDKCNDAKGNSALKLGTSSATGTFTFTVGSDVNSVVIKVAGYKAKASVITINGQEYTLTTSSNDGEYQSITIDTSTTKKITFTTVSGKCRCMIDSIEFKG